MGASGRVVILDRHHCVAVELTRLPGRIREEAHLAVIELKPAFDNLAGADGSFDGLTRIVDGHFLHDKGAILAKADGAGIHGLGEYNRNWAVFGHCADWQEVNFEWCTAFVMPRLRDGPAFAKFSFQKVHACEICLTREPRIGCGSEERRVGKEGRSGGW